jgi:hypothetical protein
MGTPFFCCSAFKQNLIKQLVVPLCLSGIAPRKIPLADQVRVSGNWTSANGKDRLSAVFIAAKITWNRTYGDIHASARC